VRFLVRRPDQAAVMLAVATLFWGMSFPLTKSWQLAVEDMKWQEPLSATTLITVRIAAALVLFLLFRPALVFRPTGRAHAAGFGLGLVNSAGFILQVVGLASTTPANSGFYTSLASVWTPILAWLAFRAPVGTPTLMGLGLGVVGAAVLGVKPEVSWALGHGEAITLISSVIFAIMIVTLDRAGKHFPSGHLTAGFLLGTGLPAALVVASLASQTPGWSIWQDQVLTVMARPAVARDVLLLTVLCSVVATHLFTVYQPRLTPARAALIYLLEPVFATLFSMSIGHDELTFRLALGGGFILLGNFVVETPKLWREFRPPP
jgi:drug/metabolite transporter (DMT)-like permease